MAICGLVITLDSDDDLRQRARRLLDAEAGLELGAAGDERGLRVPAVLEAPGRRDFERRWRRLEALPGVARLDLAYVDYEIESDDAGDEPAPTGGRGR